MELRRLLSTYIVATNGSDTADGSLATPFKTLSKAVSTVVPGDTIELRAGEYAGHVIISTSNITLESYPGELAYVETPNNNPSVLWTLSLDVHTTGTIIRNLDINGGYSYAIKTESNHDDDHPEVTTYVGASNILIENCSIHDAGQHVIKISPESDNVTIRNCEIYNAGMRDPTDGQGIDAVNADNLLVENCYIHDTSQNGIFAKGGSRNAIIQNNQIENVGFSGIILGQQTSYGFFDTTNNPELFESIDSVARNNVVINARYSGIAVWGSKNATVQNNTVINTGWDGQAGILITNTEHFIPPSYVEVDRSNVGVTIQGNTIVQSNIHPLFQIRLGSIDGFPSMSGNEYFSTIGDAQFWDERTVFKGTLSQWKTYSGTDLDSLEANPGLITAAAPTALAAVPLPGRTELSWSDRNDTLAPGSSIHTYRIYRGSKPDFVPSSINRIGITTTPAFTDTNIASGQLYFYRITVDNGSGQESRPTATGHLPEATGGQLTYSGGSHGVAVSFDDNVSASVDATDLQVVDLDTGLPVNAADVVYDPLSNTALFHFGDTLPDGRYRATLAPGAIINGIGNPVDNEFSYDFFTASGGSGNDTFIVRTATSGQSVEVFRNVDTTAPPTYTVAVASLSAISLQGLDGNDVLTFAGNISPRVIFNGGAGSDLLRVNSGTLTLTEDAAVGSANLAVEVASGAVAVFNTTQHLASLAVTGRARMPQNGKLVLVTKNLSFIGSGKLDLADNDLILDYPTMGPIATWNGSAYTSAVGAVASGRNGGKWNGNGINSSLAASFSTTTGLAAGEASDILGLSPGQTRLWDGQTVDATSVIVKYTYVGDANLDGKVNVDDYTRIDFNVPLQNPGFFNADFNYDGKINVDDYTLIDFVVGVQGSPL